MDALTKKRDCACEIRIHALYLRALKLFILTSRILEQMGLPNIAINFAERNTANS